IGAQVFKEENRAAIQAFISPTVVHFSTALFVCILATIPEKTGLAFVIFLSAVGIAAFAYSARVWAQLFVRRKFSVDMLDRLFYALSPGVGHLLILLSALALITRPELGLDGLAAALITLLLAGVRNAWDMTMWIVLKAPVSGIAPDSSSQTQQ